MRVPSRFDFRWVAEGLVEHDLRNPTLDTLLRIADVIKGASKSARR